MTKEHLEKYVASILKLDLCKKSGKKKCENTIHPEHVAVLDELDGLWLSMTDEEQDEAEKQIASHSEVNQLERS